MNKVVAFLEKYAEWLALGVASLFLIYVAWGNVLSPDHLEVPVASERAMPGEVDAVVQRSVNNLQTAMDAPAGSELDRLLDVPDFSKQFEVAMGPDRPTMSQEVLAGTNSVRPPQVNQTFAVVRVDGASIDIPAPPTMPDVTVSGVAMGNSLVSLPAAAAPVAGADPNQPAPGAAPANGQDGQAALANAVEKYWVTIEAKVPMNQLAAEWRKTFFDPKTNAPIAGLPPAALVTHVMQVEVEREEQTGPDQWGNKVSIEPLALIEELPPYPVDGDDAQQKEEYRVWAEQHLVEIGTPAFYPVTKGDRWQLPSAIAKEEAEAAAAAGAAAGTADAQPFDPATPPSDRPLTPAERQKVYLQNRKKMEEQNKAAPAQPRTRTDAPRSGGSGSPGGQRRPAGGYAPLPPEPAAGPGITDRGGQPVPAAAAVAPADNAAAGEMSPVLLAAPFDPTKIPGDKQGNLPDGLVWAHDETVVPGKAYRYRVRVKLKNPLYNTHGLTKNPDHVKQLAIVSDWTPWKEVRAPRSTEYFFANVRRDLRTDEVLSANVDVFKRHRGDWMVASFSVVPGDGIGGVKGDVDFSTGWTLVDLRPVVRDKKDCRIMVSDEAGVMDRTEFLAQVNDPFYKTLQEKARGMDADGPAANALFRGN